MTELRVTIRVSPGAARTAVGGRRGDALTVRVQERAVEGKATEAALRALAAALGVPRRAIHLVSGHASRDKVVVVTGDAALLSTILDRLRDAP